MRAILINPIAKTIEEIDFSGQYEDFRKVLECKWITQTTFPPDLLWADDEGLLKENPGLFFRFHRVEWPSKREIKGAEPVTISGRGLLLGCDEEGENQPATSRLDYVRQCITFPNVRFTGITTTEGMKDHPIFGPTFTITNRANFEEIN